MKTNTSFTSDTILQSPLLAPCIDLVPLGQEVKINLPTGTQRAVKTSNPSFDSELNENLKVVDQYSIEGAVIKLAFTYLEPLSLGSKSKKTAVGIKYR